MTEKEWTDVLDTHLLGTFRICHAVWPHMQQSNYGRIVNVSSNAGLYGNFGQANYSAAKLGILGLSNTLSHEGRKHNIRVNCVIPLAASQMTENVLPPNVLQMLSPDHVAPLVAYLAHETCTVSGEAFEAGGGWFGRVRFQRAAGASLAASASAEDVTNAFNQICDFSSPAYPVSPSDDLQSILQHLQSASMHKQSSCGVLSSVGVTASADAQSFGSVTAEALPSNLKATGLFQTLGTVLSTDAVRYNCWQDII